MPHKKDKQEEAPEENQEINSVDLNNIKFNQELSGEEKLKQTEEKYMRALADYQNLLKNTAREKAEFIKYANEEILNELIPVYDHLKLALKYSGENEGAVIDGLKYVLKQFKDVLENFGIREVETIGQKYDPNKMEAVEEISTEKEEDDHVVAEELASGYSLNGRTLKAAKVKVFTIKNN